MQPAGPVIAINKTYRRLEKVKGGDLGKMRDYGTEKEDARGGIRVKMPSGTVQYLAVVITVYTISIMYDTANYSSTKYQWGFKP